MAIGMTYHEYWYEDVTMVRAFREADKLKKQQMNLEKWLQGLYVYDALTKVAPILHAFAKKGTKPGQYPSKAYPLFGETEEQTEADKERIAENERLKAILFFRNWANAVNDNMENK